VKNQAFCAKKGDAIMENYFAVVIGGGPGGTPAAMALAASGKKVLLAEVSGKLGGACLFIGCIPSKIIKFTSDEITALGITGGKFGVSAKVDPENAWHYIQKKMDKILEGRSGGAMKKAGQLSGLTVLKAKVKFTSTNTVEITDENGKKTEASFEKSIIATGSKSWIPNIEGSGANDVIVTENFFRMEKLPKSLAIVGGGPIGIELAQIMTNLGVKVTIIEVMDSLLKGVVEKDFAGIVNDSLKNMGITLMLSSKVIEINKKSEGLVILAITGEGKKQEVNVEKVLVAAGKIPNIEGLGLDEIGVNHTNKGIAVNEFLETSVPGIYATGDVTTGPKFAHLASFEAQKAAVNMINGNRLKLDYTKNTWVLFSEPEIAVAGMTEEQAKNANIETKTGTYDYMIDATAQIQESKKGLLRFIVDGKTDVIVGVHILGKGASELIGEAALIVSKKLSLADVAEAIHPHPTLTEAFGSLAGEMMRRK
jgi:dihydrolipoamide dehydrogenase